MYTLSLNKWLSCNYYNPYGASNFYYEIESEA